MVPARWGFQEIGRRFCAPALGVLAALGSVPEARGAGNDGDVEWWGVYSDPSWRAPERPGAGEAFSVDLRVFRGDITGAAVRTWDGAERRYEMAWVRNEGIYDVWSARVAGTSSPYLYYRFEIRDGPDVDHYNALGMWDDVPPRGDFLVDTTPLGKYPLGATPTAAGTVFRVWAPNAASAAVAGSFDGWSASRNPLVRNQGFWQALVPEASPGDEYKFVFDGRLWRTDPRARRQTSSAGNSVVVQPGAFSWSDAGWVAPEFEDLVIYELHVGTFSGEEDGATAYPGRFRDAADRHLDHLVELGINAVELLPVTEFAGDRSWGYNPAFLYAVESAYGGPEDLRYFVDRCHSRGIAVVLDVVYNHMGASDLAGNLLEYDGQEIYFYPPGSGYRETPWGPRLDYGRVEVRDFVRENVRFWLEEFHLDGFRLDGTAYVNVNSDGWRLLAEIAETVDRVSRKAIVIAEHLPNDPWVTRPTAEGGAGMDAQWNDAFHDNLRRAVREAAFGRPSMSAVADGLNAFGLGGGAKVVNYIESHDEAATDGRVPVAADPADPGGEWAQGRSRVALGLCLFGAGIPMILQGQEFLEDRPFGDGKEHRIRWGNRGRHAGFFRFAKDAVRLRTTQPALRSSAPQNVYHVNDSARVLALHRWTSAGEDLVAVASLSNDDFERYDLGFPLSGTWYEVLNGDGAAYGGRDFGSGGRIVAAGPPLHGMPASAAIRMPRMGLLVFARRPLERPSGFLRGDSNGDRRADLSDAVRALGILFLGGDSGDCLAACDANGDGTLDVSDPVYLLNYLFLGFGPPPAPWPDCGGDPSPGGLGCSREC